MLRAVFFIGVAVIALPYLTGSDTSYPEGYEPEPVAIGEVIWAAQTAVSDVMGLCAREAQVCDTSGRLLYHARDAAVDLTGRAHEWLEEGPEGEAGGSYDDAQYWDGGS